MTQRVLISREVTEDFETVDRLILVFMQVRGFTLERRAIGMGRRDLEFVATDRACPPDDHRAYAQAVADHLDTLPGVVDVEVYSADREAHVHQVSFAGPPPAPEPEPTLEEIWKGGDAYGVHFEASSEDDEFVVYTSAEGDEVPLTPPEAVEAARAVLRRFAPDSLAEEPK